jgi:hypothetical protein
MATATGGSGREPLSLSQGPKKNTGHQVPSSSTLPSGDGKTLQTAAWSPTLSLAPETEKTYIVDGLGLSPRYRRTTLADARMFAQVYMVLDGDTYQVIHQLPAGPMANPTMLTATGIPRQFATIIAHESIVASGSGPASQQYQTMQGHRE